MRIVLVGLTLALAAGCGGSGSSGGEMTPADVASKAGCSDSFHTDTTEELFVRELGKCTISGAEVSLYTFKDNTARDNWYKVASGFGGKYVILDKAIITSDSSSAVDAAGAKTGGDVK